jgi:DNA helicase-4
MVQPMTVAGGMLWGRAELSTLDGFHSLRGFSRSDIDGLAFAVNAGLRRASAKRLDAGTVTCREVTNRIGAMLHRPEYVRNSQRRGLESVVESAVAIRRDPVWQAYATPDQRSAVATLEQYPVYSKTWVAEANARFVQSELVAFQPFFDSIESDPLTGPQRRACVVNEEHNLVLAGAGTGKTSVMIGRAGYLIASKRAEPEQILMLAYSRKAKEEMQERQDARLGSLLPGTTPKIKTFHALGLEIIGIADGRRPDITAMAEDSRSFQKFVDDQIESLCDDPGYRAALVRYHRSECYPYRTPFDFANMREYEAYVRENELETLRGEVVKSFEEVVVANFLSANSVAYEYERPYPIDTATAQKRHYQPDFYLPDYDIYIEHFALDRDMKGPAHFDKSYAEDAKWKRELHRKNGTTMLETYSYLKREGILESTLEEKLVAAGVELHRRSDEELLEELRKSTQVSVFSKLVSDFITLFKESDLGISDLRTLATGTRDESRHTLLLDLIQPILSRYEQQLSERNEIDFADMIALATKHVETGAYASPYAHVLVDEFQDISQARMRLLSALLAQRAESTLFVVGDDWQAIFRFAGSDIAFTREFEKRLGATATTVLDTTFRFNDKIGNVASRFVLKNPEQIRKSIASLVHVEEPAVSLVGLADATEGMRLCAEAIAKNRAPGSRKTTVLVLSRFNYTHDELARSRQAKEIKAEFPQLSLSFMSMHAAKGKEADYVIIAGLTGGRQGFPCWRPADRLLKPLLPPRETFKHAEERRLFYVALTRARKRAYLIYDPEKPSQFVVELLDQEEGYAVVHDEFAVVVSASTPVACPRCGDGTLTVRQGPNNAFAGCSNYPYCRHTAPLCPKCGGFVKVSTGKGVCVNPKCGAEVAICPKCGGWLVERPGPRGSRFMGCSNYANEDCHYTARVPAGGRAAALP